MKDNTHTGKGGIQIFSLLRLVISKSICMCMLKTTITPVKSISEITHFGPIQHGQICKGSDYFPRQIISQMAHFLRNFAMVMLHKMQPNSSQNIFNAITILSF